MTFSTITALALLCQFSQPLHTYQLLQLFQLLTIVWTMKALIFHIKLFELWEQSWQLDCLMIIHYNSLNSQIKLHVSTISSVSMRVATSVHGKSFPRHFKRSHAHKQYSVATVAWVLLSVLMRVIHQSPRSVTFSASWLYVGMSKLLASYSYSMTQH